MKLTQARRLLYYLWDQHTDQVWSSSVSALPISCCSTFAWYTMCLSRDLDFI